MATYGARYIKFAPLKNEPDDAIPTYENAVQIAELQKLSDSPSFNEGKQAGDDRTVEYVSEFKEADVDVEVTDLDNKQQATILGATISGTDAQEELAFGADDTAPYGGLGCVICRIRNNIKTYQGVLYTKAKASMQGEEFETKGDSIALKGGKLKFKAMAPKYGKWKIKSSMFSSFDAAKSWLDTKLPAAGNS